MNAGDARRTTPDEFITDHARIGLFDQSQSRFPRVFISPENKRLLDAYFALAPKGRRFGVVEISGLGKVIFRGNDLLITSIFLIEQKCETDGNHTEPDREAIHRYMLSAMDKDDDLADLKLCWHSHADGMAFWSPEDNETINNLDADWFLWIVGNVAGDYLVRLEIFKPIRISLDGLKLEVLYVGDPGFDKRIKQEIAAKVQLVRPKRFAGFSGRSGVRITSTAGRTRRGRGRINIVDEGPDAGDRE